MATARMDQTDPEPLKVPSITTDKGSVRKISRYSNSYHVITNDIQPKLLFYARTEALDKAFDAKDFSVFRKLVSETVGRML